LAKTKYDPETFPVLVEKYALEGMIEKDIAAKMGVSVSTFEMYKNTIPEFLQALKRGKAPIDTEVENALLKRALGFDYEETKTTTEDDKIKFETSTKHAAPDTTACIFWLKNRKPKEWRDKQDIEHSGNMGVTLIDDVK